MEHPDVMDISGISALPPDSLACLVRDGEIIASSVVVPLTE